MIVEIVKNQQQLEDAYAIRQKVFIEEQQVDVEEEIDEHDKTATHFVLYDNSKPIGAGRFRIVDGVGKVERICVVATDRKAGSGKLIMNEIEKFAQSQGISKVKLNAQKHAIGFYGNLGYESISEEFIDAGIPHRTMIKNL
ncbi:GNAT family N-acetyltransferase [Bacillus sp. H1a]|uniref:GNAT family N-acetyltransferase n=1 Tax=Bacillus sp. H1a TaxID=1397276 RepID=UPI0004685687|nr:GNAT family N-acetyltransferase [Bacillus sp. H1a]